MSGAVERLSDLRQRASAGDWRVCDGHPIAYMGDDAVGEIRYVGTMGAMGDPAADAELMAAAPALQDVAEAVAGSTLAEHHADTCDKALSCPAVNECSCGHEAVADALARLSGDREGAKWAASYRDPNGEVVIGDAHDSREAAQREADETARLLRAAGLDAPVSVVRVGDREGADR